MLVRRHALAWVLFSAVAGGLACTADAGQNPGPDPADVECGETVESSRQTPLPADVDAVVERKCRACHGRPRENFAPVSLVTWEDFHAPAFSFPEDPQYVLVQARINADRLPMPPIMEEPLTAGELALLNAWLDECAPPAP